MKRRLVVFFLIILISVPFVTTIRPTSAASAGCNGIGGLSGFYNETIPKSSGSVAFSAGEVINVSASSPDPSPDLTIKLDISGTASSSQTGVGSLGYTIPTSGNY